MYGGEMSAHHYFRDFAYCDSGMIPWLLVAELICLTGKSLAELVDDAMAAPELAGYHQSLLRLLDTLSEQGPYRKFPLFLRIVAYNKARLYLLLGDVPQAQTHYLDAIQRYGLASSAMQMFAEMANSGHLEEAQRLLDYIQRGVESGKLNTDPLGQAYYQQEIQRMQQILASDRAEE